MMKVEQIKTPYDIERYIEGCLNDFETAICTKGETVVFYCDGHENNKDICETQCLGCAAMHEVYGQ